MMDRVNHHVGDSQQCTGFHTANLQRHDLSVPIGQITGMENKGRVGLVEVDTVIFGNLVYFLGIRHIIVSIPGHLSPFHPRSKGIVDGIEPGLGQDLNSLTFTYALTKGTIFRREDHNQPFLS